MKSVLNKLQLLNGESVKLQQATNISPSPSLSLSLSILMAIQCLLKQRMMEVVVTTGLLEL